MEEKKWRSLTNFSTKFEEMFEVNATAVSLKPLSVRMQHLERELHPASTGSMFDVSPFKGFKVPDVNEEADDNNDADDDDSDKE